MRLLSTRRRMWATTTATVLALAVGGTAGPVPASAASIPTGPTAGVPDARGCQAQSLSAILDYSYPGYPDSTFSCSGYYYPIDTRLPLDFSARGWSGYFTQTDGDLETFCNNDYFVLLGQPPVDLVWLSATKASWC